MLWIVEHDLRVTVRAVKFLLWHTDLMTQVDLPCHVCNACHEDITLYNELLRSYLQQQTVERVVP